MTDRTHVNASVHGLGLGLRFAFLEELEEGEALPEANFLEVSPENYMRRGGYFPAALEQLGDRFHFRSHGLMMNLGGPRLERGYLDQLRVFLQQLGVKEHSDHLCWSGVQGQTLHDLLPLPVDDRHIDRVVDNIRRAQDHLGVAMSVENISYYALPGGNEGLAEAYMLAEILERADCGLLLDLNNLWVNASNHGFDTQAYLDIVPLERVTQLHVAGGERLPQFDHLIIDTHGGDVPVPVIELMQQVIATLGPRPVLYERDHNIPPLETLRQQLRELQAAYDKALPQPSPSPATQVPPAISLPTISLPAIPPKATRSAASAPHGKPPSDDGALETLELFSRVILDIQDIDPEGSRQAWGAWIEGLAKDHPGREVIASMAPSRLKVYRTLVHNSLRSAVRVFLPLTVQHRGAAAFARDLEQWLAGPGPRSKYLRDLPGEFYQFIAPRWRQDPEAADYLSDLARYELLECELEAAPAQSSDARFLVEQRPLELDDQLVLDPQSSVHHFDFAVHELLGESEPSEPEEPEESSESKEPQLVSPRRQNTALLVYRDDEHDLRYLQLSSMAQALWRAWVDRQALATAIRKAAEAEDAVSAGGNIDDDFLSRVSALIADLAERGVIKGPRKKPQSEDAGPSGHSSHPKHRIDG